MSDYLDPNNEELLKDFFVEAQLQVEIMEQNILALEDDPKDQSAIDELFRAAHTLKGGSGTVQMNELSSLTHLQEDLFDEIRSGAIQVDEENVDVLLSSIDVIKSMLASRLHGNIYEEDYSSVITNLELMVSRKSAAEPEKSSEARPQEAAQSGMQDIPKTEPIISEYEKLEMWEAAGEGERVLGIRVVFNESNPMNTIGGIQVLAKIKELGQLLKTVPDFDALYEDVFHPVVDYYLSTKKTRELVESAVVPDDIVSSVNVTELGEIAESGEAPAAELVVPPVSAEAPSEGMEAIPGKQVHTAPTAGTKKDIGGGSVLRVDSMRIDNLLNLVSESVISKATFNQISTQFNELLTEFSGVEGRYKDGLKGLFDLLPQWLGEMREGRSIKSIKAEINEKYSGLYTIFDAFELRLKATINLFRNTSANLGRNISDIHEAILRIRMVPISQIFSRFPRLVRDLSKSLDKELDLIIEGEDTELDKSVIEELLDPLMHCVRNSLDHGIESPAVRQAAGKDPRGKLLLKASNEGNLIVVEIADDGAGIDVESVRTKAIDRGLIHPSKALSDVEAFNLIFDPGFSTAAKVTDISGRGVGLDVVRKRIEKLNGTVSIWSEIGEGTRFTVKLPLTLAIIQGLLVRVGAEIYAIPITSVIESHRVTPDEIKVIDNYEVFNVREDVISLLRLGELFRIEEKKKSSKYTFIVVVGSGEKKMGLMVDSLIGEEDVVIKPLKDRYTNSPGIAGATILGDGTVSLIIDVSQLLDLGVQMEQEARQSKVVR